MKQGIHVKDNPLMSPGSNSSGANTNNNVGSPSSITSPMVAPVNQAPSTASDLENPGSANGNQMMGVGPMSESVIAPQSWTPSSVDEGASPSPSSGLSPNHDIASPNNTPINATPLYAMHSSHQAMAHSNLVLKSEISSPTGNSPSMLPSYPLSNGSISSVNVGDSNQQMPSYLNESSIPHQPVQHPSMMAAASLWYSGVDSDQNMHQLPHLSHRGMGESSYLK